MKSVTHLPGLKCYLCARLHTACHLPRLRGRMRTPCTPSLHRTALPRRTHVLAHAPRYIPVIFKSPSSELMRLDPGGGATRHSAMAGAPFTDGERRILDSIETHGWYAVHRFDPELATPNFTYTVGFTQTLNAPEFIVFGLHRDVMFDMLAGVFRQIRAGRKLADDQVWKGLHEDFDCVGRKASRPDTFERYAVLADLYWQRAGHDGHPGLIQLVWPGWLDGLYPWDAGCKARVKAAQPELWR